MGFDASQINRTMSFNPLEGAAYQQRLSARQSILNEQAYMPIAQPSMEEAIAMQGFFNSCLGDIGQLRYGSPYPDLSAMMMQNPQMMMFMMMYQQMQMQTMMLMMMLMMKQNGITPQVLSQMNSKQDWPYYGNNGSGTQAGGSGNSPPGNVGTSCNPADRPHGKSEVVKTFGAPGTNQVTVSMPAGQDGRMISVTCHQKVAGNMKAAFEEIKAQGLSGCIDSFDGSFNYRQKRGGSDLSLHSWGIAFDINASSNPMGSSKETANQQKIAQIFEKHGFHQLPNDPMHFQYATGC